LSLEEEFGEYKAMFRYEAKVFKEMVDGVSKILDEGVVVITSEGLTLRGMDPARVALIEIEVPAASLLEFDLVEGVDRVEMGVNIETLVSVVKKSKKGDQLEVRVKDDRILFKVEGVVVKRYLLPNLEVAAELPEEVKLEHDARATVIADVVKKALKDAELVGDIVEFEATEEFFAIRGVGEARSRMEARLTPDMPALLSLEVTSPATSRYDIGYLKKVLNLTKIAESIDIGFSSDKPLEIVFKSPDGSKVRYILAPASL
jgi:proliferating cell nuclear antigen